MSEEKPNKPSTLEMIVIGALIAVGIIFMWAVLK